MYYLCICIYDYICMYPYWDDISKPCGLHMFPNFIPALHTGGDFDRQSGDKNRWKRWDCMTARKQLLF